MKPSTGAKKRLLVTGGAGYVGSALIRRALQEGYRVHCLDLMIYGDAPIKSLMGNRDFECIRGDVRDSAMLARALKGVDYVVHLAAIVGDQPCRTSPRAAVDINFNGTRLLAEKAKRSGVKRFVFASTCSNYGIAQSPRGADENQELNPLSLYAETKIDAERFLKGLTDSTYPVTCLRFATGYGISPRTRFDLLINSFAYEAWSRKEIVVFAADTWRPYIHVADVGLIISHILKAPVAAVQGQIFNAGCNSQNFIKKDIAEMLRGLMQPLKVVYVNSVDDRRDYKVNFDKLKKTIGFTASKNIMFGFKELIDHFQRNIFTDRDFCASNLEAVQDIFREKDSDLTNVR